MRADDEPLPDREQILAPVQRRLSDAEARLDEHSKEAASLLDAQKRALIDENSARQSLKHTRGQIRTTRDAVQSVVDGLSRNVESIPSLFRPRLALPLDPVELETVDTTSVDRALYAVREREAILRQREQERDRLRTSIEETRTALRQVGETARTEVEAPLQTIVRAGRRPAGGADGRRPFMELRNRAPTGPDPRSPTSQSPPRSTIRSRRTPSATGSTGSATRWPRR